MKKAFFDLQEPIIKLERRLFELYSHTINSYKSLFSQYGGRLLISECWTRNNKTNCRVLSHPYDYQNYIYWISYQVLNHQNNPIVIDDENSYLEKAYGILLVDRKYSRLKTKEIFVVKYFEDVQDVKADLIIDLNHLKKMKKTGDGS